MVVAPEVAAFRALSAVEQRVACVLALVHEPLGERALLAWLSALPVKERGRGKGKLQLQDPDALRATLAALQERGVVFVLGAAHAPKFGMTTERSHEALTLLQSQGQLASWAARSSERAPRIDPETHWLHRSRLVRDLLVACHLGDGEAVAAALTDAAAADDLADDAPALLFDALGLAPPAQAVTGLLPEHRELYVARALDEALETLTPLGDELAAWLLAHAHQFSPPLFASVAFYQAVRGDTALEPALRALHEPAAIATRAFIALSAESDPKKARGLASEAFEAAASEPSRKRGGIPGHTGPWLTLLALSAREARALEAAETQLEAASRDPELFGHVDAYQTLRVLHAFFGQGNLSAASNEADFSETEPAWERALLWSFAARCAGLPAPKGLDLALRTCRERAADLGFGWLAAELERAADPASNAGLRALYTREEPWEQALSTLELLLERSAREEDTGQARARLRWTLQLDRRGRHEISARVERLLPSGWSKGNPVGWKRLAEITSTADWVSAEDLRVLRYVRPPEPGTQAAASREHVLDEFAAAALIGHPRVFASDDVEQPLEVVGGTPKLLLRESIEGLSLKIVPRAASERRVVCVAEPPNRVVVCAQTEAQWALAARLGAGGLALPLHARERVHKLLPSLSQNFTLETELAVEEKDAVSVPCDARIHVQLLRGSTGMRARLRVMPIAGGPSLLPGQGAEQVLAICLRTDGARAERTQRDLDAERERCAAVLAACPSLNEAQHHGYDYRIDSVPSCLELLRELARLGDQIVVEWPEGQPLSIVAERDLGDLRLSLSQVGYWLSADGDLPVDAELKLSLRQLLEGLSRAEGRFLPLSSGRFLALTDRLKQELDQLSLLAHTKDNQLLVHPLALASIGAWAPQLAQFSLDEAAEERLRRVHEANAISFPEPAGLDAELRPYQREGFAWLSRLSHWGAGACLADDMGLGKTLQTLALLLAHAPSGPSIVVAPTSVTTNWVEETARFAKQLRVVRLSGEERDKLVAGLGPYDLLVTSYGMMQQSIDALERRNFSVVVLDEAQAIKNAATLRAKTAMRLSGNVRIALTGTPVENHLGELWSIMSFLNPGLLGSARSFEQRFAKPIQREGAGALSDTLRRIVHPFILRRKKSEVLSELPEKTVITLHVTPSSEERALYAALREQALGRLRDPARPGEARLRLLAELMRMRRAACHPSLAVPEAHLASSKLEAFEELIVELREEGHRALVFSQFVDYLSIVKQRLESLAISYQYLDGSTSQGDRARAVRAFQAGEGDVFLISLRAGGFGLNLTAADYVIHLDPWWNPAVEDQASDRAHRIGQTRPVTIYRLVMEGSIEEKILALHDDKRDLADRLLEGTDSGAALSVETLTALIREVGGPPEPALRAVDRSAGGAL